MSVRASDDCKLDFDRRGEIENVVTISTCEGCEHSFL